jgi:hypothetical protein
MFLWRIGWSRGFVVSFSAWETIFRCGFLVAKSKSVFSILDEDGKDIVSKIGGILILDENHFRYSNSKNEIYVYNKRNDTEIISPSDQYIHIENEYQHKYYVLKKEEKEEEFYNYDWEKIRSTSDQKLKYSRQSILKTSTLPIIDVEVDGKRHFYNRDEKLIGITTKRRDCGYVLSDSSYLCLLSDGDRLFVLKPDGSYLFDSFQVLGQGNRRTNLKTGLFPLLDKQGHVGIKNHKSQWIIKPSKQAIHEINSHYIVVLKNKLYFTYNHKGKLIQKEGFSIFRDYPRKGKLRYVGHVEKNMTYQEIRPESCFNDTVDTLTRHYVRGGYIDEWGKIKFSLTYSETKVTENNIVLTKGYKERARETFLYNKDGSELILKTNYDFINPLTKNLHAFTLDGKQGLIDNSGEILLGANYIRFFVAIKDYFFSASKKDGSSDLINNKGKVILENITEHLNQDARSRNSYIQGLEEGYHLLYLKDRTLVLTSDGSTHMKLQNKNISLLKTFIRDYNYLTTKEKEPYQFSLKNVNKNSSYYYTNYKSKLIYKR